MLTEWIVQEKYLTIILRQVNYDDEQKTCQIVNRQTLINATLQIGKRDPKQLGPLRRQRFRWDCSAIKEDFICIYIETMNLHLLLKIVFFSAKVEVIKTILRLFSFYPISHTAVFLV